MQQVVRHTWGVLRFPLIVTSILVAVAVGAAWYLVGSPRGLTTSPEDLEAFVLDVLVDAPPDQLSEVRHQGGACNDRSVLQGPQASASWTVPVAEEQASRDALRDRILSLGFERGTAIWNEPVGGSTSVQGFSRLLSDDGPPSSVSIHSEAIGVEATLTVVASGTQRC